MPKATLAFFVLFVAGCVLSLKITFILSIFIQRLRTLRQVCAFYPGHSLCWTSHLLTLMLTFRYGRLAMGILANGFMYRADPIPDDPTYHTRDVHVVISTIDPRNAAFERCVRSILANKPGYLTIATGGEIYVPEVVKRLQSIGAFHSATNVDVRTIIQAPANKRQQMRLVMDHLAQHKSHPNRIVVFVDDHAWWPNTQFLKFLIAPFEDPHVGLVGVRKQVQRDRGKTMLDSFINFLACIYLERHNFEITAQNAINGGAFVVSARSCAVRASIVSELAFREGFTNERLLFGFLGPLAPDDDNYITRYVTAQGRRIKFQNHPDCTMWTTLGDYPSDGAAPWTKFHGQLIRWARSQWRSNIRSLLQPVVWSQYWLWSAPIQFFGTCINLAAFWDPLFIYLWTLTLLPGYTIVYLLALIIGSKLVKLFPHLRRQPADWVFFPGYLLFAYYHSLIKIWSALTWWDLSWSGRDSKTLAGDTLCDGEPVWKESAEALHQADLVVRFVASTSLSMPNSFHILPAVSQVRTASAIAFAPRQSLSTELPKPAFGSSGQAASGQMVNDMPVQTHYHSLVPPAPSNTTALAVSSSLMSAAERRTYRSRSPQLLPVDKLAVPKRSPVKHTDRLLTNPSLRTSAQGAKRLPGQKMNYRLF